MAENFTKNFAQIRLQNKRYKNILSFTPPCRYLHREGWIDTVINNELIFSHRNTWYVVYFSERFFDINGQITPLTDFINNSTGNHMVLSEKTFGQLLTLLKKACEISETDQPYTELVLKAI